MGYTHFRTVSCRTLSGASQQYFLHWLGCPLTLLTQDRERRSGFPGIWKQCLSILDQLKLTNSQLVCTGIQQETSGHQKAENTLRHLYHHHFRNTLLQWFNGVCAPHTLLFFCSPPITFPHSSDCPVFFTPWITLNPTLLGMGLRFRGSTYYWCFMCKLFVSRSFQRLVFCEVGKANTIFPAGFASSKASSFCALLMPYKA